MPELKIQLTAGTNVGLVRGNNEDNFVVCRDLTTEEWTIPQAGDITGLGDYGALLVVADGMGGANAGEVASSIAIETIQNAFTPERVQSVVSDDRAIQAFMTNVTCEADKLIVKHSKKHVETQGMGTTLVMAWVLGTKVYVCWCGDSRCYVYNPKEGLMRLSKDHSFVQELVDRGELQPELAHNHPMSNIITQCLGSAGNRVNPDTRIYDLHHDDVLLLCSDGLCGLCTDDEILQVMGASSRDVVQMKGWLIDAALKAGGYDNVTVALCRIDAPGMTPSKTESEELRSTLDGPKALLPEDDSDGNDVESDVEATVNNLTASPQPREAEVNEPAADPAADQAETDHAEADHAEAEPEPDPSVADSADSADGADAEPNDASGSNADGKDNKADENKQAKPVTSAKAKGKGCWWLLVLLIAAIVAAFVAIICVEPLRQHLAGLLDQMPDTVAQPLKDWLKK